MTHAPADLRYPIGPFKAVMPVTHELRGAAIDAIEGFPARIREAVAGLSDAQLDTPYRPEGWTVRQVVHHVADSHMNALIRVKLALTEDTPTIKPYDENAWSTLPDMTLPIAVSLEPHRRHSHAVGRRGQRHGRRSVLALIHASRARRRR